MTAAGGERPVGARKVQGPSKDEDVSPTEGGTEDGGSCGGGKGTGKEKFVGWGQDKDKGELESAENGVERESAEAEGESGGSEGRESGEEDDIPFAVDEGEDDGADAGGEDDGEDFAADQAAAEAELDEEELGEGEGTAGGGAEGTGDGATALPDPRTQGLAQEGDGRVSEALRVGLAGVEAQLSDVASKLARHSKAVEALGERKTDGKKEQGWEQVGKAVNELSRSVNLEISAVVGAVDKQSEAFGSVKADVDVVRKVGKAISGLLEALRACQADLSRQRELEGGVRRWTLLVAVVVGAPALVLAGTFAGQRWEVLPMQDATGGWRDHVWESYGGDVIGCVRRGLRDGSSFECVIDVRGSVEEVRARGSGQ